MLNSHTADQPGIWRILWLFMASASLLGLILRLVGLSAPPFDAHHFRQTQTLYTIEDFHAHGIDLLHPRTIYTGYPGTFVLEFPIFQAGAALLYDVFGSHIECVRLLNIFFGALTVWILYRIASRIFGRMTGILTAIIFWLAPLNILYERSTLLDPMAVALALVSFYALLRIAGHPNFSAPTPRPSPTLLAAFIVATIGVSLVKTLYLWPSVLLIMYAMFVRRFRFDLRWLFVFAVFVVSGASFFAWNRYAAQINDASIFTRGVTPTSLLGFSALFDPQFYYNQFIRRPKLWLGAAGLLFYVAGLIALWRENRRHKPTTLLLLVALIPPTYLVAFANINHPHDYYQLIIAPFLAMISGFGVTRVVGHCSGFAGRKFSAGALLGGVVLFFLVTTTFMYLVWMRGPYPDQAILKFQHWASGQVQPGKSAMIFADSAVTNQRGALPAYLYALKVWGYANTADGEDNARAQFEKYSSGFPHLDYVILFGLLPPRWLAEDGFRLTTRDDAHALYVFQQNTSL